jgi:hypothetical protein
MNFETMGVLRSLASLEGLPGQGVRALSRHPATQVRLACAWRQDVDHDTDAALLRDPAEVIRLARLARTRDTSVLEPGKSGPRARAALAANPRTSSKTLAALSEDPCSNVVRSALQNPRLDAGVAVRAARKHSPIDLVAGGSTANTVLGLGLVLEAHPQVAQAWVGSASSLVARVLARSPGLTEGVAQRLAVNPTRYVALALGGNPAARCVHAQLLPQAQDHARAVQEVLGAHSPEEAVKAGQAYEMARVGSHTLDTVLSRQVLAQRTVEVMLGRSKASLVEADTLTRVVQLNGHRAAMAARSALGLTKLRACSALVPEIAEVMHDSGGRAKALKLLPDVTDLDEAAWESLVELSGSWHADLRSLAAVASGL